MTLRFPQSVSCGCAWVGVALAALGAPPALAQIVFIPGPPIAVSAAPGYVAAEDFNRDGVEDAAVAGSTEGLVSVLSGVIDGTFSAGPSFRVGQAPQAVAAGDLNCDQIPEIALLDAAGPSLFVLTAASEMPYQYETGPRPVDLAIGDFDGQNCKDLAVADAADGTIRLFYSVGRDRGFGVRDLAVADPSLAESVARVGLADFNGDALDDIVAIIHTPQGADQLALLLNDGGGSFDPAEQLRFPLGNGATALTINDFNSDHVPDVAVLNAAPTAPNTFAISVLADETEERDDGTLAGTGSFRALPSIPLTCPVRINLTLVNCLPQDIGSGDFDADGFIDLAVSVSTTAVDDTAIPAGFVSAFQGRGDGGFVFGTQVIVGLGPRQIAVGDFTGDGSQDLAVTEFNGGGVRILRSIEWFPPPQFGCWLGTQCASGFCVDETCCAVGSCSAGERCDLPGHEGDCFPVLPAGSLCAGGEHCGSGFCVDGTCCAMAACENGLFCNTGECSGPGQDGTPCTAGEQCSSGNCFLGECRPTAEDATPCSASQQCSSGNCVDRVCCNLTACSATERCDLTGAEGTCHALRKAGEECAKNSDCLNNDCRSGSPPRCRAVPTATPRPTPRPPAEIAVSSATGTLGETVQVQVTLRAHDMLVAGAQNDLGFAAGTAIPERIDGSPDCLVNPAIDKAATQFGFQPFGCTPGSDCRAVRAIVVAADNSDPIPDGALLYTCTVRIGGATPPGDYPLNVSFGVAGDPRGVRLTLGGIDGKVVVLTPPDTTPLPTWTVTATPTPVVPTATRTRFPTRTPTPTRSPTNTPRPSVVVSTNAETTAGPGEQATIAVTLRSGPNPVAGVQLDLSFGLGPSIASRANGRPDCQVNPEIDKGATAFAFQPAGCGAGYACQGVRALVLAADNTDPIADGAVLFTCTVTIGSDTPPGDYPLYLFNIVASDPEGVAWTAVGENAEVTVVTPPGATPIPTWTPVKVNVDGAPPPAAPFPRFTPGGIACGDDPTICGAGFCVDDTCCSAATCPDGERCDILGFAGRCAAPREEASPCEKNTDCTAPLVCAFDASISTFVCRKPPSPTPTLIPFTPEPTNQGPVQASSQADSDGGCTIQTHDQGMGILLLVPAAWLTWWRRRRLRRRGVSFAVLAGALTLLSPADGAAAICAYVPQRALHSLAVIDTGTNAVTGQIPVGGAPLDIAVAPDGQRLYVLTEDEKRAASVAIVDTTTHVVASVIPVPGRCVYHLAVSPDGAQLAVPSDGAVNLIDTASEQVTAVIGLDPPGDPCACEPDFAVFSADSSTVYVTRGDTSCAALAVVDTSTNTVSGRLAGVGSEITDLAATLDGEHLYLAADYGTFISGIDLISGTIGRLFLGMISPDALMLTNRFENIAVAPDGRTAYVTHRWFPPTGAEQYEIIVVNLETGEPSRGIPLGQAMVGAIAFSPDGRHAYAVSDIGVLVLDTGTLTVAATIPVTDHSFQPIAIASVSGACLPGPTPTVSAGVSVTVSSATAAPGDVIAMEVRLETGGRAVAGIQSDIGFDSRVAIAPRANGRPDCTVNPEITKGATNFGFQPPHCTPGFDCNAFRSLVFSTDNVDPIADGALLFTCRVEIAEDALPGAHVLSLSGVIAADPSGREVPASGRSGTIAVILPTGVTPVATRTPAPSRTVTPIPTPTSSPPPPGELVLASGTGAPGEQIVLGVTLRAPGSNIAAVQNVIHFDPRVISVAMNSGGKPDCSVNPAISKPATAFALGRCVTETICHELRAVVIAFDNTDPIPDDSVLYTCAFQIGSTAPPGSYSLGLSELAGSDPFGNAIRVVGHDAEITVVTAGDATPIPTWTPVQAPLTPQNPTTVDVPVPPGPMVEAGQGSENSNAGCAIARARHPGSGLFLLLAAVTLLLLRRTRCAQAAAPR